MYKHSLEGKTITLFFRCIKHTENSTFTFRSIQAELLDKINTELEKDVMIRAIHDVKGIDMGNSLVRYKVRMIGIGQMSL